MILERTSAICLLCLYLSLKVPYCQCACPEGEFSCGNLTDICVAQRYQCDGEDDCGNNGDEIDCARDEGNTKKFDELRFIDGSNNKTLGLPELQIIEECDLDKYPKMCICYLTRVACIQQSLTSVPEDISANVTKLNLADNHISNYTDGAFRNYTNLKYLSLTNNRIQELPPDVFMGLQNLGSLYLNQNFLGGIKPKTFKDLGKLIWLFMDHNNLTSIDEHDFYGLDSVWWITLGHNKLTNLKKSIALRDTPTLAWLDLEWNSFQFLHPDNFSGIREVNISLSHISLNHCGTEEIHHDTFSGLQSLTSLALEANRIQNFPSGVFRSLTKLETLNISDNPVTVFPNDVFDGLQSLLTLYLNGIKIKNINKEMFQNLTSLEHVVFSKFSYCQYVPHVRACLPRTDGISSFENLLRNIVLRVFVWTIALITSLGNIGVFISRFMMKSESRLHSLAVINLCAADFIMSIYLFNIAIHDVMYRENYNKYSFDWMESWSCRLSGFLAMVSGEVSVLILTFISVERFMTIAFPYRVYKYGKKELVFVISCIWFVGITIGMIPLIVPSSFGNFYGSNGVCFPLHIHDPSQKGWEYSAFVFLAINATAFTAIFVSYIGMFSSIQKTRKATAHVILKGDMNYAKRFFCIVLTDLLCWLPIAIVKLMALCNIVVSETLYGWIIVFILPINSALNPILYTMSTTSFTQWFNKQLKRGKCQTTSSSNGYLSYNHWRLSQRSGGRASSLTETTEFTMAAVSRRSCPDIKTDGSVRVLRPISENHISVPTA